MITAKEASKLSNESMDRIRKHWQKEVDRTISENIESACKTGSMSKKTYFTHNQVLKEILEDKIKELKEAGYKVWSHPHVVRDSKEVKIGIGISWN